MTLTALAAYAATRISSKLKGSTKTIRMVAGPRNQPNH